MMISTERNPAESEDNESHVYLVKTDTKSSLQVDRKTKHRSYTSQFTLNDKVQVAVSREEDFQSMENKVTVEVDICLGVLEGEKLVDDRFLVKLGDMAAENAWVYRMTNYCGYVDQNILTTIKIDAMEPNKQYNLQYNRNIESNDEQSCTDSKEKIISVNRKLRSTISQFNAPFDNKLEKLIRVDHDDAKVSVSTQKDEFYPNMVLTDVVYPQSLYVDNSLASYIDPCQENDPDSSETVPNDQIVLDIVQEESETSVMQEVIKPEYFDLPIDGYSVLENEKQEIFPYTEEWININASCDNNDKIEDSIDAPDFFIVSSPSVEQNIEDFKQEQTEFVDKDAMESFQKTLEDVGSSNVKVCPVDDTVDYPTSEKNSQEFTDFDDYPSFTEYMTFEGIRNENDNYLSCQENLVLEINGNIHMDTLDQNSSLFTKDIDYTSNNDEHGPVIRRLSDPISSDEDYEFVPVAVRRKHYESLAEQSMNVNTPLHTNSNKLRLITSDNYIDMVSKERPKKDDTTNNSNKKSEFTIHFPSPQREPSNSSSPKVVDQSDEEFEKLEKYFEFKNHDTKSTIAWSVKGNKDPGQLDDQNNYPDLRNHEPKHVEYQNNYPDYRNHEPKQVEDQHKHPDFRIHEPKQVEDQTNHPDFRNHEPKQVDNQNNYPDFRNHEPKFTSPDFIIATKEKRRIDDQNSYYNFKNHEDKLESLDFVTDNEDQKQIDNQNNYPDFINHEPKQVEDQNNYPDFINYEPKEVDNQNKYPGFRNHEPKLTSPDVIIATKEKRRIDDQNSYYNYKNHEDKLESLDFVTANTDDRKEISELKGYEPGLPSMKPVADLSAPTIDSPSLKFDNFLKQKERQKSLIANELDEEEDPFSSLKNQKKQSQNVLRHGDSIEDIEKYLIQQQPEFANKKYNVSDDDSSVENPNYHYNDENSYKNISDTSSFDEGVHNVPNKSVDAYTKGDITTGSHTESRSSSSRTLSSPSDTESNNIEIRVIDRRRRNNPGIDKGLKISHSTSSSSSNYEERTADNEYMERSGHSSTSSATVSSAEFIGGEKIDHLEEYENAYEINTILKRKRDVKLEESSSTDSVSDEDVVSSLSDQDPVVIRKEKEFISRTESICSSNTISTSSQDDPQSNDQKLFDERKADPSRQEVHSISSSKAFLLSCESKEDHQQIQTDKFEDNTVDDQRVEVSDKNRLLSDSVTSNDATSSSSWSSDDESINTEDSSKNNIKNNANKNKLQTQSSSGSAYSSTSEDEMKKSKLKSNVLPPSDKIEKLEHSSASEHTIPSSSDEEIQNINVKSECQVNVDDNNVGQYRRLDSTSSDTASGSSDEERGNKKNFFVDRLEEMEIHRALNTNDQLKRRHRPNQTISGPSSNNSETEITALKSSIVMTSNQIQYSGHSIASEHTIPSSSEDEIQNINVKSESQMHVDDNNVGQYRRLESTISDTASGSSDEERGNKKNLCVDRLEEMEIHRALNTNDQLKLRHRPNKTISGPSSKNAEIKEKENIPQEFDDVEKMEPNHKESNNSFHSSQQSITSTSAYYIIMNNDGELAKRDDKRYQTMPIKNSDNSVLIRQKSKSLDAPLIQNSSQFSDIGNSTIEIIERRYNETTETWSKQSLIAEDEGQRQPRAKLEKKFVKKSDKNSKNSGIRTIATTPRPFPSYLSPVNSFPYVPSDGEYSSQESMFSEYDSDNLGDKKCSPSYIRDISRNNLPNARLPIRQNKPCVAKKSEYSMNSIDLNYGAADDDVDFSNERIISRASSTSVTTDGSYLDKPIFNEKLMVSSLAKLDSLSSLSESTNPTESIKVESTVQTNKCPLKCPGSSYSLSTSTSSLSSNLDVIFDRNSKPVSQSESSESLSTSSGD